MTHAQQMCGLMIQPQRIEGSGERPRLSIKDATCFVPNRRRKSRRQRVTQELPHGGGVAAQQCRTKSIQKGEHSPTSHWV